MSTSVEDQIQKLRGEVAAHKQQVELRDAILRLNDNADFRLVFEKKFMEEEALRACRMSSDPMIDRKMQKDMMSIAASTGHVRRFLSANIQMGNRSEGDIVQLEEEILQYEQGAYDDEGTE